MIAGYLVLKNQVLKGYTMALKLGIPRFQSGKIYMALILTTRFYILTSIFNFLLDKDNFLGIIYFNSLRV